jgi:adenylate cyclase
MGSAPVACGVCGTGPIRDGARFCDVCGAPTATTPEPAEYKQVTVLFADVVRSMDMASTVEPERLREIMAAVFDRSAVVVQRYGGTVDKFTGDGLMALFGAPVALEDHALRGCLAALGILQEIKGLAAEVDARDHVALQLRVGLDSGQVVAGGIGAGQISYTAFGEHVGIAQRMESVAPPGGVAVSESTARLVENTAVLAEPELVHIKGTDVAIPARQLLKTVADPVLTGRREWTLVGRQWEMGALTGLLDESIAGRGCVVGVVGAPGIGKTRLAREVARIANESGVEVFSTFCESHGLEVSFHVVARMLRTAFRLNQLDATSARALVRARLPAAEPDDVALLQDLIGIQDNDVALPDIEPDARRRRLAQLINTALLGRQAPALYVIEDAHWIDRASEEMFAEFFSVIPRIPAMVLVTYRPEYRGVLTQTPGSHTISLSPLSHSQTAVLAGEMLGPHPSVKTLVRQVAERAVGNPFFAEEIVRDLVGRGVLHGNWSCYVSGGDVTEVSVPATVQAIIAARIDRLGGRAKHTLNAAAVIGLRFDEETLVSVLGDAALEELTAAELIDPVVFAPHTEYAFRHPLIRTVAYESQLKSGRAELHRCLARVIEQRDPGSVDENAALIATHLEAAGNLREAFSWHMRAGSWSRYRDIGAARVSWQRARQVADRLPAADLDGMSMRIAPRTLLCGSAWHIGGAVADAGFDELRDLTAEAGDKRSLAIGMAGWVCLLAFRGRYLESSRLASECVDLIESVGDSAMTVGLLYGPTYAKYQAGEVVEGLRLAQRRIDLAAGDLAKGDLILGSPLALGISERGAARCCLGIPGWMEDFDNAIAMARGFDATTRVIANWFKYGTIPNGTLLADSGALQDTAEVLQVAEQFADDFNLGLAQLTRGLVLVHRDDANREAGFELMASAREKAVQERFTFVALPIVDTQTAKEKARIGDLDGAIALSQAIVDDQFNTGEMIYRGPAVTVLVESLLQRGAAGDVQTAQEVIDRLAAVPTDPGFVLHEIPLLRLRALVARQGGDQTGYRDWVDRYRATATACGFQGHMAIAEAMRCL